MPLPPPAPRLDPSATLTGRSARHKPTPRPGGCPAHDPMGVEGEGLRATRQEGKAETPRASGAASGGASHPRPSCPGTGGSPPRDVILKLLDDELLLGEDVLDVVPDVDHTDD